MSSLAILSTIAVYPPYLKKQEAIVRYLYTCLFYLALPFVFLRLAFRALRLPAYRHRLGERLGFYPIQLQNCIWVHAVSVGETLAAIPLIKTLKSLYPNAVLLVTSMTPTGADRVKAAFGDSVQHAYLPYDLPGAVKRFLRVMQPRIGIIMETELWPNLLAACHEQHIPVCLVNARLSAKSATGYARIAKLTREMLNKLSVIAAHGEVDAKRFIALGANQNKVIVTGNLKFDLELPQNLAEKSATLRSQLGNERFVWIAASTHEGEEAVILAAHQILRTTQPHALLILVPRHPDRFDNIATLCAQSFKTIRRSLSMPCTAETAVYLGDTMGELLLMYGAADVAFVGGSLIPRGGHNMLEPAALQKAILTGPHLFNFAEISEKFAQTNALIKVSDANTLAKQLLFFAENQHAREEMGKRALEVVTANRGALAKQIALIQETMG